VHAETTPPGDHHPARQATGRSAGFKHEWPGGQSRQPELPALLYIPAGQCSHVAAVLFCDPGLATATMVAYVPEGQSTCVSSSLQTLPGAQAMQEFEPTELTFPGGQLEQLASPTLLKVPAGHGVPALVRSRHSCPPGQSEQVDARHFELNEPTGHTTGVTAP
jgi:hypothetical protein